MQICPAHWQLCREAVDQNGLSPLLSKDTEEAMRRVTDSLENPGSVENFDPLFSISNYFMCEALRCGGLYLIGDPPDGSNNRHYCPICEFVKHSTKFDAKEQIYSIAAQMASWARDKGLIAKVQ